MSIFTVIKTTDTNSSVSPTAPTLESMAAPILWSDISAGNVRDMVPIAIAGGKLTYWFGVGVSTQNCYGWGSKIINDNAPHIINFERSLSSTFAFYIDGTRDYYRSSSHTPLCTKIANQNPNVLIGASLVQSKYYKGYISEIIVFEKVLTTEERTAVNKYLSKKYAIKIS